MKRLLAALLLVASPALAQSNGWQEIQNGWGEIQTATGGSSVPTGCVATSVPIFLGSPVAMGCDPGLTYDPATDTLTSGKMLVGNGTGAAPTVASTAQPTTGLSWTDAPQLEFNVGGMRKVYLDNAGLHMGVPIEFGGYPAYLSANAPGVVTVGASAAYGSKDGSLQLTTLLPATNGGGDVGSTTLGFKRLYVDYTNTATVGAVEINKAAGRVNIDTAGTSVVVTNSLVTVNSHVLAVVSTADATAYVKNVVPAAGSFTITLGAAAGAPTSVDFFVLSSD